MEGLSFILILFITMPLKYQFDMPKPNLVVGMAHGVLFMLYLLAVIQLRMAYRWKPSLTVKALLASVVPFGTFYMDRKIFRNL
jgi:integral membrane protein